MTMALYLRKFIHPQAHDNYRVILKREGDEVEIGSIGVQRRLPDRRPGEIILANDIGRAGTNLPCRQQSMPDQANNGHLADAEAA